MSAASPAARAAEHQAFALTASRLVDGVAVFFDGAGFSEDFGAARLFSSEAEAEAALEAARAQTRLWVDPYLVETVATGGEPPAPVSFRERIRALGPTVRPDLGKQAAGGPLVEALRRHASAGRSRGRLNLIRRK